MKFRKPKCAVVLAGGLGTRLRSAVSDLPKPMAIVQGEPFLAHIFNYWKKQGVEKFIFCLGYKSQIIIDHFGNIFKDCSIDYSIEEIPLGTGGAVIAAVKKFHINEPFVLLNGDTFFEVDLEKLHNFSVKNKADWCFSLFDNNDISRYLSISLSLNGRLSFLKTESKHKVVEQSNPFVGSNNELLCNNSNCYGNGGVYWVNPKVFEPFLEEPILNISLENDIFPQGVNLAQAFFGLKFAGTFIDIGLPEDYYRSQSMHCFL
jgi:D-glycero-alpha-D-manno-heptose 1-phosphate guanylyltransferase